MDEFKFNNEYTMYMHDNYIIIEADDYHALEIHVSDMEAFIDAIRRIAGEI